jgi:hypothetical protein
MIVVTRISLDIVEWLSVLYIYDGTATSVPLGMVYQWSE